MPADAAHQCAGEAGIGHEADAGKRRDETRALGGDDEIGGKCQAHPRPSSDPVHGPHDRLRQPTDGLDERVVFGREHVPEVAFSAPAAQVGARAEASPGPGQDHGARRVVLRRGLERGGELHAHRRVQSVQRVGAVECDRRDPRFVRGKDRLVGHVRHRPRLYRRPLSGRAYRSCRRRSSRPRGTAGGRPSGDGRSRAPRRRRHGAWPPRKRRRGALHQHAARAPHR